MRSIAAVLNFSRNIVPLFKHCCGARVGAGGAEIIWDQEPEPKFFFTNISYRQFRESMDEEKPL